MGQVRLSLASVVTEDVVALSGFYADVFGLVELVELRSEIFRGLDVDGVTLGFSTPVVYELLGMQEWREARGTRLYLTFEASSDGEVDRLASRAVACGGRLLHEPFETYYGAWQAVLADPDGNVFRINYFRS